MNEWLDDGQMMGLWKSEEHSLLGGKFYGGNPLGRDEAFCSQES